MVDPAYLAMALPFVAGATTWAVRLDQWARIHDREDKLIHITAKEQLDAMTHKIDRMDAKIDRLIERL